MAIIDGKICCHGCEEAKSLSHFYPSIVAKGCGLCRACSMKGRRAAEKSDPDKFKAYRKKSAAKHPDAQRLANQKMSAKKKAQFLARGPSKESIRCSSCGAEKPISEYQPSVVVAGSGVCRPCKYAAKREYERANPAKVNAAQKSRRDRNVNHARALRRAHYRNNPETYRGYNLSKYGITAAEYEAMLAAQGGRCACCGRTANRSGKRLFVDHDHATGAIRGVICHNCNIGIGSLGDTIEGVRRALNYLERAQQPLSRVAPTMRINLMQGAN